MDSNPRIDPLEFCQLLKQVDRQPPRMSRDLEPDFIGLDIKQRILDATIAAAPAAEEFERALLESAATLDDVPAGATRGVCSDIMLEWRMAHASPHFLPWLREEAARPLEPRKKRRADHERDGDFPERSDRPFFPPPPITHR